MKSVIVIVLCVIVIVIVKEPIQASSLRVASALRPRSEPLLPAMQLLGQGGYGSVVALDDRRVCKIQHSLPEHDAGVSAAALREMSALARLYPHRTLRMLLHSSGTTAIEATRYRESLLDAIRRWRRQRREQVARHGPAVLREEEAGWVARVLRIVADLAAELARARAAGFLHRDLKPENVMLDGAGRAHLIDWGMSRWAGWRQEGGGGSGSGEGAAAEAAAAAAEPAFCFTPGMATLWYRAPELFTGDAYGAAVDVWSLGVLLVELVAGRCPFRGASELQQLRHYLEVLGPPPRGALRRWPFPEATAAPGAELSRAQTVWAAVPEIADVAALPDLVDRMIRWDPRSRATPEEILLHPALAPYLQPRPSQHPHAPSLPPPPPLPPLLLRLLRHPSSSSSSSSRRLRRALDGCVRRVILPLARSLRLPAAVPFAAGRFLVRCSLGGRRGSERGEGAARGRAQKPHRPRALDALLCLDLANKLVGLQQRRVLDLPERSMAKLTARQVRMVNRRIGVAALGDAFVRMPRAPLSRALLAAALRHDPCGALVAWGAGSEKDVAALDQLARFVDTGGGMMASTGARASRSGLCNRRLARLLSTSSAPVLAAMLPDKVMRRRLAAGLAGL